MRLKHVIIMIIMMMLILFGMNYEVKGAGYTTHFYDSETHKWAIGDEMKFTTSNWYKSYNIFCTEPGANTPTSIKVYNRMDTSDGKNYVWQATDGQYTEEQTAKILYIYSTLDEDIQNEISSRSNNWETPQQHAIWEILGLECSHEAGKNYAANHATEINKLLADATAYYNFYKANGFDYKTSIDTSNIQFNNNVLGPFTINYQEYTDGHTGKYGGVSTIELVKVESNGEISKTTLCYDSTSGNNGLLSQAPKANTDLYISGISNVNDYNAICVRYRNTYASGYLVLGDSLNEYQQSSLFGSALKWPTQNIQTFTISTSLKFNLKKTDEQGTALSGVKFEYAINKAENGRLVPISDSVKNKVDGVELALDNGWAKFMTNNVSSNEIEISNIPQGLTEVYVAIKEIETLSGYKPLGQNTYMVMRFTKNTANEWERDLGFGIKDGIQAATYTENGVTFAQAGSGIANWEEIKKEVEDVVSYNNSSNTLIVKNEKISFSFSINKVDNNGTPLSGAEIRYIGPYILNSGLGVLEYLNEAQISETGTRDSENWHIYTTDGTAKEIKISGINTKQDIYILVQEKKAPERYEANNQIFALEFKYDETNKKWQYSRMVKLINWITEGGVIGTENYSTEEIKYDQDILTIINKPATPDFSFNLLKTDSESGEELENVKFTVIYEGITGETYLTDVNGQITIPVYVPSGKNKISVNVHEITPSGYKSLGYGLQLTFEKENDKWKCTRVSKLLNSSQNLETIYENGQMVLEGELVTFKENSNNTITGTVLLENERENNDEINLSLYKVDASNYSKKLNGAVFKISVTNGTINGKSSDSITVNGSKSITIKPINTDETVEITIKETTAPDGYKLPSTAVTLKYKYKVGSDGIGDWIIFDKSGSIANVSGNGTIRIKNTEKDQQGGGRR